MLKKGGVIIGRKSRPLNPIQWNAFAIVFILAVMPFAVAFITNAGSSGDGELLATADPTTPVQNFSFWIENGGTNFSDWYILNNPANYDPYFNDCTYIHEGFCAGYGGAFLGIPDQTLDAQQFALPDWSMPIPSSRVKQSHFWGDTYLGQSGDGAFAWYLSPDYFDGIEQGESIDRFVFSFIDLNVDYACSNPVFENLSFNAQIIILYNGKRKVIDPFFYETSNAYPLTYYDNQNGQWKETCRVGFDAEMDFTGFEAITLYEFNGGDWANTSIELYLDNFKKENGRPIALTALPFAGNQYFALGTQYQPVNPVEASFIIKLGTLILAVGTFGFALASTPYWSPLKTLLKGLGG